MEIEKELQALKEAARVMPTLKEAQINQVLSDLAHKMESRIPELLTANKKDLDRMDPNDPKYDRLLLNEQRIQNIANDIRNVADLPSPLSTTMEKRHLPNGLELEKVSVPLGIVGVVFESRPNVTFDVFSLCFKAGNAVVLKGSRDAHDSNMAILNIIHEVLEDHQLPKVAYLAPSEREALPHILGADQFIDAIIPRGGQGLINFVRANSKVPVIETGAGIVHTYVDKSASLEKAKAIIKNAKTRRVSVCNALDTLLLHQDLLQNLPYLVQGLDSEFQLILYTDQSAYDILLPNYDNHLLHLAQSEHFGTEFLSMKMAIKIVRDLDEALQHIFQFSSKHSEAIVAEAPAVIDRFFTEVDAAVVYANTSTAFTDGAEFGMGAEIGISTQKLHARGPMALKELTSYKWLVRGTGQIR